MFLSVQLSNMPQWLTINIFEIVTDALRTIINLEKALNFIKVTLDATYRGYWYVLIGDLYFCDHTSNTIDFMRVVASNIYINIFRVVPAIPPPYTYSYFSPYGGVAFIPSSIEVFHNTMPMWLLQDVAHITRRIMAIYKEESRAYYIKSELDQKYGGFFYVSIGCSDNSKFTHDYLGSACLVMDGLKIFIHRVSLVEYHIANKYCNRFGCYQVWSLNS